MAVQGKDRALRESALVKQELESAGFVVNIEKRSSLIRDYNLHLGACPNVKKKSRRRAVTCTTYSSFMTVRLQVAVSMMII